MPGLSCRTSAGSFQLAFVCDATGPSAPVFGGHLLRRLAGQSDGRPALARLNVMMVVAKRDFVVIGRSEEHTSELQSLMRISYAVFCLKKQITQQKTHKITSRNA